MNFNYIQNLQSYSPLCPQVTCVGQMVCAVVADSKAHAKRGAAAVKIGYEDLQDRIFTVEVRRNNLKWSAHFYSRLTRSILKELFLDLLVFRRPSRKSLSFYLKDRLSEEMWKRLWERLKMCLKVRLCCHIHDQAHLPLWSPDLCFITCGFVFHRRDSDRRTGAFLHGNTELSGHSSWGREGDESLFVHSASYIYASMLLWSVTYRNDYVIMLWLSQ